MAEKKNRKDIKDLVALDNAYGRKLNTKRIFKICAAPSIYMTVMFTMFTLNPFYAIAGFILGFMYGYNYMLPREVEAEYKMNGYEERNRTLNLLTQSLMDPNKTIIKSIQVCKSRANGEFQKDLSVLEAIITNHSSTREVKQAFKRLIDKYKEDVVFGLYMEQLESAIYDGRNDNSTDIFKNIKNQHNQFFNEYRGFAADRDKAKGENYFMLNAVLALGIAVSAAAINMSGFALYDKIFFTGLTGLVTGFIFIIVTILVQTSFFKKYYSDSVSSI